MKKNVAKALSLGLSAVTLAGSTSITAFAQEENLGEGNEQQSNQQEANQAEQTFAEDVANLNEEYNEEEFSGVGSEEDATGVPELTEIMADEISKDESPVAGETCTINVLDEDGNPVTEEVTFDEAADKASYAADSAGADIENLNTDADNIYTAAQEMDTAAANANAEVSNANQAASDAETAANGALKASEAAVAAVENETKENAATIIGDAQKTYDSAANTFTEKEQAYNNALTAYATFAQEFEQKVADYNNNLNNAYIDLEAAEADLNEAKQRLSDLQDALQQAYDEYLASAAGALATAEQTYQDSDKTVEDKKAYLKAILENFYLKAEEGQSISVTDIGDFVDYEGIEKDVVSVTYQILDENGDVVDEKKINLGYDINGGQVDLYEKVTYFDYTDAEGNVQHITQEDIDAEAQKDIKDRTIIKRYEKTVDGKTTYLVEDAYNKLSDEEKAEYTFNYIVLGAWDWNKAQITELDAKNIGTWYDYDGKGHMITKSEEVKTDDEIARVYTFDVDGNYICTVTNFSTKMVYTFVNSKLSATEYLNSTATAKEIAESKTDYTIVQAKDTYTATGYYVPRYVLHPTYSQDRDLDWGADLVLKWSTIPVGVTPHAQPTVNDAIANGQADAAAHAGDKYSNKHEYYAFSYDGANNDWSAVKTGDSDPYNITWVVIDGTVTYHVAGTYNISYDIVTDDTVEYTMGGAWNDFWTKFGNIFRTKDKETIKEAIIRQYEEEKHTKVVDVKSWNWDTHTAEFYVVKPTTVNNSGATLSDVLVTANKDANLSAITYNRTIDYVGKSTATYDDSYKKTASQASKQKETEEFLYNDGSATFSNIASGYSESITNAYANMEYYFNLINLVNTAKEAVQQAQQNCEDIRSHIEELNKTMTIDELTVLPELAEWEGKLEVAESEYNKAKEELSEAQDNLKKANDNFNNKYKEDENQTGGGTTSIGGGAGGGSTDYPATTTIADPSVALAGDGTVVNNPTVNNRRARRTNVANNGQTIADPDVALAGGDGAAETPAPEVEKEKEQKSIADEETPLAVEDVNSLASKGWWISILLILLIIAGSVAYYKKKMDAKITDDK